MSALEQAEGHEAEGPSEARRASRPVKGAHGFAMRSAYCGQEDSRSETRIDARDLFDDDDLKTTGAATQCAWTPSSATGPEEHSVSAGDAVVESGRPGSDAPLIAVSWLRRRRGPGAGGCIFGTLAGNYVINHGLSLT